MKRACIPVLFVINCATLLCAQSNPVPLIYQPLSPATVPPGSAGFILTVRGTGFMPGAVVKANRIAFNTRFVNATTLKAQVPATAVAKAMTGVITVANPGGIDSNAVYFSVRTSSSTVAVATDSGANIAGGELVVGDFNNDNSPDVSLWGNDNMGGAELDTYFSEGNGAFQEVNGPQLGLNGATLCGPSVTGDFNRDGNLDVGVCNLSFEGSVFTIFLGDGRGGYTVSGTGLGSGVAADINGDGILDLVTTDNFDGPPSLLIYLGKGDGTFTEAQQIRLNLGVDGTPVVGDFNDDGKLDVAVAGSTAVGVLLGNGDGTLQTETDYPIKYSAFGAAVADLNGDGKLDIVTSGVTVLLGRGDGTFRIGPSIPVAGINVEIADFNGDGKLDAATVGFSGGESLSVLLGTGDGSFQSPLTFNILGGSLYMGIADFNNDGLIDFAIGGLTDRVLASTVLLQTTE